MGWEIVLNFLYISFYFRFKCCHLRLRTFIFISRPFRVIFFFHVRKTFPSHSFHIIFQVFYFYLVFHFLLVSLSSFQVFHFRSSSGLALDFLLFSLLVIYLSGYLFIYFLVTFLVFCELRICFDSYLIFFCMWIFSGGHIFFCNVFLVLCFLNSRSFFFSSTCFFLVAFV